MKSFGRKTKLAFFLITGFLVVWSITYFSGFRFLKGESMEEGLYRYVPGVPERGDFVAFYLPKNWSGFALERRYLKPESLHLREQVTIKHVAASKGDQVKIDKSGIWVNGELLQESRALKFDSGNRPMPEFSLEQVELKEGEFLVISHGKPNGFDSRYYGILKSENLVSRVIPIFYF